MEKINLFEGKKSKHWNLLASLATRISKVPNDILVNRSKSDTDNRELLKRRTVNIHGEKNMFILYVRVFYRSSADIIRPQMIQFNEQNIGFSKER